MLSSVYLNLNQQIGLLESLSIGLIRNNLFSYLVSSQYLNIIISSMKCHSKYQLKSLVDIVGYDLPGKFYRFGLVYILLSHLYNIRIKVFTRIPEINPDIVTISIFYSSALWLERELWEMFGVFFLGHFDLRRLLSDYCVSDSSPKLRKDVGQLGYYNARYNEFGSSISYEYMIVNQALRLNIPLL